jgi:hypothetical protein
MLRAIHMGVTTGINDWQLNTIDDGAARCLVLRACIGQASLTSVGRCVNATSANAEALEKARAAVRPHSTVSLHGDVCVLGGAVEDSAAKTREKPAAQLTRVEGEGCCGAPHPFCKSSCPRRESNSHGVAPGGF